VGSTWKRVGREEKTIFELRDGRATDSHGGHLRINLKEKPYGWQR